MIDKKKILSLVTILVLGLTPIIPTAPAYAASSISTQTNFFTGLVQFLANTFHLDKTQVQNAVNIYARQHKEIMQQKLEDREKAHLDALASQGKITSSKEQQIESEQTKLKREYTPASFKNMSPEERQAALQKEKNEIQAWSKSTGIDVKYLRPGFGIRMHMFNKWNTNAAPTP